MEAASARLSHACHPLSHRRGLLLETHANTAVHLARQPRWRLPGAPLASVSGACFSRRAPSLMGSPRVGRPTVARTGAARDRLSLELAVVLSAAAPWIYRLRILAVVFRGDPF